MRKIFFIIILFSLSAVAIAQQNTSETAMDYRRSSLYKILIIHPQQKFAEDVRTVYYQSPFPDKFNNHSLSILSITSNEPKKYENPAAITVFLRANNVGQRLVAKWFERDKATGTFDVNYLAQSGLYDADAMDKELAALTKRGSAMLADAGEEMIKNTFVVVYDIVYIDKEENAQKAKDVLNIASQIFKVVGSFVPGGSIISGVADLAESTTNLAAIISDLISGFTVKVTSYLYQLEWDDNSADKFYSQLYIDRGENNPSKKALWEASGSDFKLKFIGSNEERSEKTVTRGLYSPQDVIRKVVNRSLDKSLASLQKDNEVFRVKVPISQVNDNVIRAKIGLKEGVSNTSTYEILERRFNPSTGRTVYRKVGEASPINGRIWDNRYMSEEEGADNASLEYTDFAVTSSSNIYPGMLIREGKSRGATINVPTNIQTPKTAKEDRPIQKDISVQNDNPVQNNKPAKKANNAFVGRTMIMAGIGLDVANLSDFSSQRLSYGLTVGWVKRWGGYAKFKTNAVFQNESNMKSSYDIWTTGEDKVSNWSFAAGGMFGIIPNLYLNLGVGWGERNIYWEDINYNWIKLKYYTLSGVLADIGLTARFGSFAFSLGTTCTFDTTGECNYWVFLEPEFKIGVMF